jgi:hypothetical protein
VLEVRPSENDVAQVRLGKLQAPPKSVARSSVTVASAGNLATSAKALHQQRFPGRHCTNGTAPTRCWYVVLHVDMLAGADSVCKNIGSFSSAQACQGGCSGGSGSGSIKAADTVRPVLHHTRSQGSAHFCTSTHNHHTPRHCREADALVDDTVSLC